MPRRHRASRVVVLFGVALMMQQAQAHLSGVFAHFVQDINAPTASTRMLQHQLNNVSERLEELRPEVQQARADYASQSKELVRRVRFYDVYAGSAIGALWAGAQDPVDVLASTALLQKRLGEDMAALTELAASYQRLHEKERALRRYAELLQPFAEASQSRDRRLSDVPPGLVSPFAEPYIAYRIAEDWEALRGSTFVLYFKWAARRLATLGLREVMTDVEGEGTSWKLTEEALNAAAGGDSFPFIDDARFFLRADHVYFSASLTSPRDAYHLMTVGQLERTGPLGMQYRIEAIFLDGMPIDPNDPDVQREVYQGALLGIEVGPLKPPDAEVASFEQQNGAMLFTFR